MALWSNLEVSQRTGRNKLTVENNTIPYSPIIEVTGLIKDELGRVHLVANVSKLMCG